MTQVRIASTAIDSTGVEVKKQFIDCAYPVMVMIKNTGAKTVKVTLYGGFDDTRTDMIPEIATEGTTDNPHIIAGGQLGLKLENPYDYILVYAVCPTGGETSTIEGALMWQGPL